MSVLSILQEDGEVSSPPSVLIVCANPIYPKGKLTIADGVEFAFEVLEVDAGRLKFLLNRKRQYSLDSGPHFLGELKWLEPCDSEDLALSLMRSKATLCGVIAVIKVINLAASSQTVQ